ncbi:unnamed protein product, partial [Larinioides sclopetarius]
MFHHVPTILACLIFLLHQTEVKQVFFMKKSIKILAYKNQVFVYCFLSMEIKT